MRAQRTEADKRLLGRPAPSAPPTAVDRRRDAPAPADVRTPAGVLQLQRRIGNRAVGSLLRGGSTPAHRGIQRFPYTLVNNGRGLSLIGRWENPYLNLYSHGVELGYIKISTRPNGGGGTILELKDILVHDVSMRGANLGTVLVYLFGELAVAGGFASVAVLLPNGTGLYARTGFVITPNAINPANPPTITGVPATIRNTARGLLGAFRIGHGEPPPARPARVLGSLNSNGDEGNAAITNADL